MSMDWVRQHYGVPAKRGQRVDMNGNLGTITRATHYVWVRFDDYHGGKHPLPCHPTWRMTYFDRDGQVLWSDPEIGEAA
jgi:hypothetical protein